MLRRFPLIDGHNDLPWALRARAGGDASQVRLAPADPGGTDLAAPVDGTHTDLPRLRAGGVGGQFWSVYVPASLAGGRRGHRRARADRPDPPDDRVLTRATSSSR